MGATRTELTAPGTVLGTAGYMSPEQVRGEPCDARSDIFSFGAVLYEMAGGERPFRRDTQVETMTAILRENPPELTSLSHAVPPALAGIVRRCLEKQPGERFQSAHDLAFSLEAFSGSTMNSGATVAIPAPRRVSLPAWPWIAALLLVGALAGAAAVLRFAPQPTELQTGYASLTARRGTVTAARFVPGDQAAVYSATWDGGPLQVFTTGPGSGAGTLLPFDGASLLAVSPTGELALSLDRRHTIGWEAIGTLAVAASSGTAPRPILEDVLVADWSPDGQQLAVAHEVDGVVRLEYPIGTVLYESPGWISELRVHPDGDRVAFADNPSRGDNVCALRVVDRQGKIETLARNPSWGLLWMPGGDEILFSGGPTLSRVRPGGQPQLVRNEPVSMGLLDVDAQGNVLAGATLVRRELFGRAPNGADERSLSWLDWGVPRAITPDGKTFLFEEGNQVTREGYAIFVRGTDGAPPVQVGFGTPLDLSPDGRWVLAIQRPFSDERQVLLMPTGAGTARPVDTGGLQIMDWGAAWVRAGAAAGNGAGSVVAVGRDQDGSTRLYLFALEGGAAPRAVSPADLALAPAKPIVSPDGSDVVFLAADGRPMRIALDAGAESDAVALPGLAPGEEPLTYDSDGRHLYVLASGIPPAEVVRVEIATGAREPWLELSPGDAAGIVRIDRLQLSGDGASYVYSCRRLLSQLTLISGLF
jgi:Tol biopolymer transport system component